MVRGRIRVAKGAVLRATSSARAEKRSVIDGDGTPLTDPNLLKWPRMVVMVAAMAISEAARAGLYNRLKEVLGPEESETLMGALPLYALDEVATRGDIESLRAQLMGEIGSLRGDLTVVSARLDALEARMDRIEAKVDRLTLILITGLFGIIATLIGIQFIP
jgi:hypothetical protein